MSRLCRSRALALFPLFGLQKTQEEENKGVKVLGEGGALCLAGVGRASPPVRGGWAAVLGSARCPPSRAAPRPPCRAGLVLPKLLRSAATGLLWQGWDINHCQARGSRAAVGGRVYCQVKVLVYLPGTSCSLITCSG